MDPRACILAIYIAFTASPADPLNTLGAARSFILLARSVRMITSITAEERAGQNACSVYDRSRVQDGVGPIDPRDSSLFRANDRLPKSWPELQIRLTQLARESLRRQAWPTSGEVVTGFQSDSPRTDSPVQVLHAQPPNPVSIASHMKVAQNRALPRHFADMISVSVRGRR